MWNIIYNAETLSSVSLDRDLIYPLPVRAILLDVRCDNDAVVHDISLLFNGDFAPGDGGGLAAAPLYPNESMSLYPTTTFLKQFNFSYPVSQIHFKATSPSGKKLYIAQLAEYYPS